MPEKLDQELYTLVRSYCALGRVETEAGHAFVTELTLHAAELEERYPFLREVHAPVMEGCRELLQRYEENLRVLEDVYAGIGRAVALSEEGHRGDALETARMTLDAMRQLSFIPRPDL
ncbi:hypothetical protein [Salininema proteolyticum]|uniref:Uncharacterized protein n=1 Tax=Salininema proteolyticum TaxID=1607685 RepID=A0ABV8TUZ0_9ACTN